MSDTASAPALLDIGTLKAEALKVLASLKTAAPAAPVAPPVVVAESAAITPATDPGKAVAAGAPAEGAVVPPPEPTPAVSQEALRERLETTVKELAAKAAVAPFLPAAQHVLVMALQPRVSLEADGKVMLRAADGTTQELTSVAVDALLGEAADHFKPASSLGGSGAHPAGGADGPARRSSPLDSQAEFEKAQRGRRR